MHDYVIVGAGSAGCVLANRLSEDPALRVLMLEAGGRDRSLNIKIPAAFPKQFHTKLDWDFATEPEAHVDGRSLFIPRGKALGGSSSMNAMLYVRGRPLDYDGWEAQGAAGWGYRDVLPYFIKSEDNARGPSEYHGTGGPLKVSEQRSPRPLDRRLLEASEAAGIPRTADYNGPEQDGVSMFQVTQRNGQRYRLATAASAVGDRGGRGAPRRRRAAASRAAGRGSQPAGPSLRDRHLGSLRPRHSLRRRQAEAPRRVAAAQKWPAQLDRGRGRRLHAHARRAAGGRHPVPHGRRLLRRPRRRDLRGPLHGDRTRARLAEGPRPGVAALGRPDGQAADHHEHAVRARGPRVDDRRHAARARDRLPQPPAGGRGQGAEAWSGYGRARGARGRPATAADADLPPCRHRAHERHPRAGSRRLPATRARDRGPAGG